jgi:Protein of unknown function (DUF2612)
MDYTTLITGEHADKPNFMALVAATTAIVGDTTATLQSFPAQFDVDLAAGAQLDIIGLWVGVSRVVPDVLTIPYFGFADNVNAGTFGELADPSLGAPFFDLGDSFFTATTILSDAQYRRLLYAQILSNQADGTAANLVAAAEDITNAPCELVDPGNLAITLKVGAPINLLAQAMITQLGVLPVPAGVILNPINYTNIDLSGGAAVGVAGSGDLDRLAGAAADASAATGNIP